MFVSFNSLLDLFCSYPWFIFVFASLLLNVIRCFIILIRSDSSSSKIEVDEDSVSAEYSEFDENLYSLSASAHEAELVKSLKDS